MSVEIVGPFQDRRLVIDGWRVPLMSAIEHDGGTFDLMVDNRIAVGLDSEHFERVARFVADVIGTCFGYGAHPMSDEWYADAGLENRFDNPAEAFRRVPHPTLAPHRVTEILHVQSETDERNAE